MHGDYYEAILQVRPGKPQVERFVRDMFKKTTDARISKKKRLKEGVDYYITSHQFAITVGNALVKKFGGSVEVSKKTFGKRQGKTIFRRAVAYRSLGFDVGEVISSDNTPYVITSVGKAAVGKNLITGKKEKIVPNHRIERLKKFRAVVSQSDPLEVINNEDYQSVAVENMKKSDARKLTVVNCRGRIYSTE